MTPAVQQLPLPADSDAPALPARWPWLFRKFRKYSHKYAARHFHAVRVAKNAPPPRSWQGPAILVLNHPSWWDPIIAFVLSSYWPTRLDYAPMDDAALNKYSILSRVGLFGVKQGTIAGAADFLKLSRAVLARDDASIWITAQGQFTDVRERPVRLMPGVGHLAAELRHGVIIPVALEYPFWDERTPEALIGFGPAIHSGEAHSPRDWTRLIAVALESAQDRLAIEARSRDAKRFHTIVAGRAGVGGMYDLGRRLKSWLSGRRFRPGHKLDG